jgi:LPS sulfotransferase NodH
LRPEYSLRIRKAIAAQMLDRSRDIMGAPWTKSTYILCGSQRTGSTLIASILRDTGVAGDPLEYFNPIYIRHFVKSVGHPGQIDIQEYLRVMGARRTTRNGVFGMKIHLSQLLSIFGNEIRAVGFLKQQSHLVHVRRRDKVEQAISLYRALRTAIFSTDHERIAQQAGIHITLPEFNAAKIAALHNRVCKDDEAWIRLFEKYELKHSEVFYEDFVADIAASSRKILIDLGIDPIDAVLPTPRLEKQSDSWNSDMKARYLEYLAQ